MLDCDIFNQLLEETANHINDYALIGLRTLAVAKRDLTEAEYQRFVSDYQAASQAMSDRRGGHWEISISTVSSLIG